MSTRATRVLGAGGSTLFEGEVRAGGTFTRCNGSTLRTFGAGTGPFASGFYERYGVADSTFLGSGTFRFFESGLAAGTNACPH